MYNDVAFDEVNPFPGELYSHPGDDVPNVYEDVIIDYEKDLVNPENVIKVLLGDKSSGGKVLESTEIDNVLLYFVNYGAPNVISLPGGFLYSDDLLKTFTTMHTEKKYNKMVVYLEGSQSGSVFQDLPTDLNILAITSGDDSDSSWSWYCEDEAVVKGIKMGTCLGTEFSVKLLEDMDRSTQSTRSLQDQFKYLFEHVSKSHVSRFGDLSFSDDLIGDFVGYPQDKLHPFPDSYSFNQVNLHDNKMTFLRIKYESTDNEEEQKKWRELMNEEQVARRNVEKYMLGITRSRRYYMDGYPVKNFNCYRNAVNKFLEEMGYSEYALKLFKVFSNMCNEDPNAF